MQYHEIMHEIGKWEESLEFKNFLPSPLLKAFVKSHQLLTGQNNQSPSNNWYILPDNSAHLIFCLYEKNGPLTPRLSIVGPRTQHKLINRYRRHLTLITTFRPGAISFFNQHPTKEFTDQAGQASQLLDGVNDDFMDKMFEAAKRKETGTLIQLVEKLLLANQTHNAQISRFLEEFQLIKTSPLIKVRDMANQLGISERHLRTLCLKYIGQSPKDFLQIIRFTNSLLISNQHREWSAIAYDAGYFDQSHMIAAYQRMCGTSPEKLFGAS